MPKTAVITCALSPESLFPVWRRYYGGLFGEENLFVVTYGGQKSRFDGAGLHNLLDAGIAFEEAPRARLISDLVVLLLRAYDVVLRCDVDEFLVPTPGRYRDLADYVARCSRPYVTARGVEVLELPGAAPLDLSRPVLPQRRYGLRATALYKTALTKVPLRWGSGFHSADVPPVLDDLYLFHLKWADLRRHIAWHVQIRDAMVPGSSEHQYFTVGAGHLTEHQAWLAAKPREGAVSEAAFEARFLAQVEHWQEHSLYQGKFYTDDALHEIDPGFVQAAPGF